MLIPSIIPVTSIKAWRGSRTEAKPVFYRQRYDTNTTTTKHYSDGTSTSSTRSDFEYHTNFYMTSDQVSTNMCAVQYPDGEVREVDTRYTMVHSGEQLYVIVYRIFGHKIGELYYPKHKETLLDDDLELRMPSKPLAMTAFVLSILVSYWFGYSLDKSFQIGIYAAIAFCVLLILRSWCGKTLFRGMRLHAHGKIQEAFEEGRTIHRP